MSTRSVRVALHRLATTASPAPGEQAGLLLDRYLAEIESGAGTKPALDDLYDRVADAPTPAIYHAAYERWRTALATLPGVAATPCTTSGRLVVGLGADSIRETSIALHRGWGVPILPGSALKGLAQRYLLRRAPADAPNRAAYRDVLFGSTSTAGHVTFFDAWYIPNSAPGDRPLVRDTITVHHPRYYNPSGQRRAPWDFDDPTPIAFLSARGSYLVAVRGPSEAWARAALDLLTTALADWGVGAKTSSGYGRLEEQGPRQIVPVPGSAPADDATTSAASRPGPSPTPQATPSSAPATQGPTPKASLTPTPSPETPPPSPTSLVDRIAAVADDFHLNEHLAALAEQVAALPEGAQRDAASRAIVRRLQAAGTWNRQKTQARPWVQAIIRYLNARGQHRRG